MTQAPSTKIPANVWILAVCQALGLSAGTMMILVSGLLAVQIGPSLKWVTMPTALLVIGTATSTIWVAMILRRFGRKNGTYLGYGFALLAAGLGYAAAALLSFPLLLICTYTMGISVAFLQQFRFAALESVSDPTQYGPVLSIMMGGGLLSAFIGPEIGAIGRDLLPGLPPFTGSFVLLAGVIIVSAILFQFYREPTLISSPANGSGRPLRAIMPTPQFIIPALCAGLGFGVMSFVMTATPITMYEVCGFTLDDTKRVIQSHVIAMFLPSMISGGLMRRFGIGRIMTVGATLYAIVVLFGLGGQELFHFWGCLILLGVGWNFLFMGGTALLPRSYETAERFKTQAANDLIVFSSQAIASLSSGWFLFSFGWNTLLLTCIPLLLVALVLSLWQQRLDQARLVAPTTP